MNIGQAVVFEGVKWNPPLIQIKQGMILGKYTNVLEPLYENDSNCSTLLDDNILRVFVIEESAVYCVVV